VFCISPRSEIYRKLDLVILLDGSQLSTASFEYYVPPMVLSVFPSLLMTQTSSIVSVIGVQFVENFTVVRFGPNLQSSKVSFLSSTKILCNAPSLLERNDLSIAVSSNDGFDFTDSGKRLVYEEAATVESLRPSRGSPQQVGQIVTIFGKKILGVWYSNLYVWFKWHCSKQNFDIHSFDLFGSLSPPGNRFGFREQRWFKPWHWSAFLYIQI